MALNRRVLALGGILGPLSFLTAWLVAGALAPAGYSPLNEAISRLAAVDASTRWLMTAGLVAFIVGVLAYAAALRAAVSGAAWMAAAANGAATVGVAAVPLAWSPIADDVHAGFAVVAYLTIVLVPALAARPLAQTGYSTAARLTVAVAMVAALCLAGSMVGILTGLLQRLGLTLAHLWIAVSAAFLARGGGTTASQDTG